MSSKQTTKKKDTVQAAVPANPFCIPRPDHPEVFLSGDKAKRLLFLLYYKLEQEGHTNLFSEEHQQVWKDLKKVYNLNLKTYEKHMKGKTVEQLLEAPDHQQGSIYELLGALNKPIF